MPEIDEIITVLKIEDNDALEAIRKLDSTAKDARTHLEQSKDVLVDIKDELKDPIEIEADIKEDELGDDNELAVPVKLDIQTPDDDEVDTKEIELNIPDVNVEKKVTVELEDKQDDTPDEDEPTDDESTDVKSEDDQIALKIKEGPDELVSDERVDLLAEQRFDLDNMPVLGAGISRTVRELSENSVVKYLNKDIDFDDNPDMMRKHLSQNLTEGSHEGLPDTLEVGIDYSVVKKARVNNDHIKVIMKKTSEALQQALVESYTEGMDETDTQNHLKQAFNEEAGKVDEKYGSQLVDMAEDSDDTVDYEELIRTNNMGFVEDVPTPIDPGGLAWRDTNLYININYPGGVDQFNKDIVEKAMERREMLRDQDMEKEIAEEQAYLDNIKDDGADPLSAGDPMDTDNEQTVGTMDVNDDVDVSLPSLSEFENILQEMFPGGEEDSNDDNVEDVDISIENVISQLSGNDFAVDDPNITGLTEDDVSAIVTSKVSDILKDVGV